MSDLQLRIIRKFLDTKDIEYNLMRHVPVYTSEEAARVRGVDPKSGVKALILRVQWNTFVMALVPENKKVDLKKLAKILGLKRLSLAEPNEVLKTTGCEIGSVHPFGNIAGLPTFIDREILKNERVEFSAGLHTVSISINTQDLVNAIKPRIEDFSL
jgi:Cys-tRNA(Pro) deacylase